MASLGLAGITVAWLVPPYLCWRGILISGPFAGTRGGPIAEALSDTVLWPAGLSLFVAVVALAQRRRHRWLGAVTIAIVCTAVWTLVPGLWK